MTEFSQLPTRYALGNTNSSQDSQSCLPEIDEIEVRIEIGQLFEITGCTKCAQM